MTMKTLMKQSTGRFALTMTRSRFRESIAIIAEITGHNIYQPGHLTIYYATVNSTITLKIKNINKKIKI
jgi:hypothetical protein